MYDIQTIIKEIIGEYKPITFVSEYGQDVVANGLAGVDWSYLFSGILLILAFYSVFRILGIIFSRW